MVQSAKVRKHMFLCFVLYLCCLQTNDRLKSIEREYAERGKKSAEV